MILILMPSLTNINIITILTFHLITFLAGCCTAVMNRIKEAQSAFSSAGDSAAASLNPSSNQVAIGIYSSDVCFRYIETYVDKYVELSDSNPSDIVGSEVTLEGKVLEPSKRGPCCCIVYHDPPSVVNDVEAIKDKFSGLYFDFTSNKASVVWPWEMSFNAEDGSFKVPISFDSIPAAGSYYVQVFVKEKPGDIPYGEKEDGYDIPGEGAVCATGLVLSVSDKDAPADSADDNPALSTLHIESGTIEERQAQTTAIVSAQKPDPNPISEIEVLAGLGLVVPQSSYEQNLFVPVERQESGTITNLTFAFRRVESAEESSDELGFSEIRFVEGNEGQEVDVPPGFTIIGENLCKLLPGGAEDAAPEEKKGEEDGPAESQGGGTCYLCVEKSPVSGEAPLIVDIAVVYAEMDFEMGGGYVTTKLPQCVCDAFKSPIYVCTKLQGAGKQAAESMAVEAAKDAKEAIQHQLEETGSLVSEQQSLEEFDLDVDLSKEEMLREEREMAERMAEAAAQEEEEAKERAKHVILTNLQENIESLEKERDILTKDHTELQRKLAAWLSVQKRRENTDRAKDKETMAAHEIEKQYNDTLTQVVLGEEKLTNQKNEYDKIAIDLQTRLDEKESKANDISMALRDFKREICKGSENSRTGKPMPKKLIKQFEDSEIKKDEEAERVRLKNINLKMTVKKLENNLRAKEQLAEGLHLIDFEQLKIENQTLNEKIEERNEELHKLRKKNTTTVQVLTHIKEKLQAVQADNGVVRGRLGELDAQLSTARDRLTKLKREREIIRGSNAVLKQKQGFASKFSHAPALHLLVSLCAVAHPHAYPNVAFLACLTRFALLQILDYSLWTTRPGNKS